LGSMSGRTLPKACSLSPVGSYTDILVKQEDGVPYQEIINL
jgi:hypothetical protein